MQLESACWAILPMLLELFKECLKIDANNAAAMYELGTIYFNARKDDEAIALITNAIKIDPKNEWYRMLLADIYSQLGKNEDAAKVLGTLETITLKSLNFFKMSWATELLKAGKYEEGIKVYNRIEESLGITEEISIQKHSIYLSMKQGEKAAEEIKKLIASFPTTHATWAFWPTSIHRSAKRMKPLHCMKKWRK